MALSTAASSGERLHLGAPSGSCKGVVCELVLVRDAVCSPRHGVIVVNVPEGGV